MKTEKIETEHKLGDITVALDLVELYIDAHRKHKEAKQTMEAIRSQLIQKYHETGTEVLTNGTDSLELSISRPRTMKPANLQLLLRAHKLEGGIEEYLKEPTVDVQKVERLVKAKVIPRSEFEAMLTYGTERLAVLVKENAGMHPRKRTQGVDE